MVGTQPSFNFLLYLHDARNQLFLRPAIPPFSVFDDQSSFLTVAPTSSFRSQKDQVYQTSRRDHIFDDYQRLPRILLNAEVAD